MDSSSSQNTEKPARNKNHEQAFFDCAIALLFARKTVGDLSFYHDMVDIMEPHLPKEEMLREFRRLSEKYELEFNVPEE